jgi:hypothetical protein
MLTNFGWRAIIGIILSNLFYLALFRKEFSRIGVNLSDKEHNQEGLRPIPSPNVDTRDLESDKTQNDETEVEKRDSNRR